MANFNKVILLGNLTRDVEVRFSQSGLAIGKFGMAVNRQSTTKEGEKRESTCFVDLTAFGRQAEVLQQYIGKGSPLFVEGRLEYSAWESQDGSKRNKLEVIVENFQFVGGRGEKAGGGRGARSGAQGAGGGQPSGDAAEASADVDYGDIPF
ncbi:MAG: single-stranded DNA-binding protein [Planctomycetota bacterium]|jgi:single-strand DNA-binding protein